jgi:hypothetical protein
MATGIQRPRPIRVDSGHRTYCFRSGVAGCLLGELHPGGQAQLGVDAGEVMVWDGFDGRAIRS